MNRRLQDGIGLLASTAAFVGVNYFHFSRWVTCYDCFFPYGLPFTFFRAGGLAGGGIVSSGLALDLLVVVAAGIIFSRTLGTLLKSHSNLRSLKPFQLQCPQCSTAYNLGDYRLDATVIHCSACGAALPRLDPSRAETPNDASI